MTPTPSRLRVLIVEQGGRGGVADYTGCLARALADRGLDVLLATASDHRYVPVGYRVRPIFAYVRGATAVVRLLRRAGLGRLMNGLRFLMSIPPLVLLARRSQVIHVQGWERSSLGLIATLAMRTTGTPIVYTAHNTFERRPYSLDSARLFSALARETIVHTAFDRDRLPRPAHVIPHGSYVSLANHSAGPSSQDARRKLGFGSEDLIVLLFGHLRPDKGLSDLLQALRETADWKVLVAGEEDGALSACAEELRDLGQAGRVVVREGFHDSSAVAEFFAAADIVALPYGRVSQSGVLHLAYAFETPVIAYPVGGLVESVISGRSGWLCSEANPTGLARALAEAARSGRADLRRMGEWARTWAAREFDWDTIAVATDQVYRAARR